MDVRSRFLESRNRTHSPHAESAIKRRRQLHTAGVTVGIVIALGSALFTGLTYWDQHNVDQQTSLSARYADARLVSAYASPSDPSLVIVQNLGQQPVYDVVVYDQLTVSVFFAFPLHRGNLNYDGGTGLARTVIGELPPCDEVRINFDQSSYLEKQDWVTFGGVGVVIAHAVLAGKAQLGAAEQVTFADANGNRWLVIPGFGLEAWAPADVHPGSSSDPIPEIRFPGPFSPAAGCS